jgi:hypothetical protein
VKSFLLYTDKVNSYFHKLDRTFAWKITFQNLFQPLYKDYTIVGYVLGFTFRLARLFVASLVYGGVFVVALGAYLVWVLLPPYFVIRLFI